MTKYNLLGATALQTGALILFAAATPAIAQSSTTATPPAGQTPAPEETTTSTQPSQVIPVTEANKATAPAPADTSIVVTGSRIRRPNLESVVPVTSIQGEQFFQQGQTNVGDALNNLPQLRSTFAQQNPGLGVGIAGLNLLDLRGLGPKRTLVLVNGHRHVPADILSSASVPDINTIPNDLIDRVDIVTGGNSAVYGSDAVAGVVNFILKRDFDGLQLRAQGADAAAGFGANYFASALWGKNFLGGKANVTLHGEYVHEDRIFGSDIPWYRSFDSLAVVDVDTGGLPQGSDDYPDRTFIRDIRSASINRFGLIPITQSAGTAQCGMGIGSTNGPPGVGSGSTRGTPYNCTYIFTPDGQLTPQTGTRYGQGIIGGIFGGNGQTGREDKLLSVIPEQDRYNLNALAHFTVSDAFEPFVEAKWSHIKTLGSNAGPSFIQGGFTQFDIRERVRLDNPFLTSAQRALIANAILTSGCNTSLTASCNVPGISSSLSRTPYAGTTFCSDPLNNPATNPLCQGIGGPLNASDISQINAGTYRFVVARQLADSGIRDELFKRDTYRVVGGARGTFNSDWSYEISANYGKFDETTTTFGYLNRQRFLLSLDAGRNPTTGQIQCRSQFDPAAAVPFAGQNANLAADIAACVPYNPFGGSDNSAAAKYFTYNATNKASMSQLDFLGFINGDSSQLFELPGGPVSFVLGGEYRRERAEYHNDPFIEAGATNAVVVGEFDPPTFTVKEAFGEVNVPILKDVPFFHELTLSGAGRVSKYRGSVGTVWTYNAGGEWSPIRDIRFRGNYGKAVRAPNVAETGFPVVPNFAPGFLDPCAAGQIANNPNRQANCLADLGATLLAGLPNVAYSLPILSGSNPDLKPEVSYSLTLGAVVQPRFIPGFAVSVDYFDIKVKKVIVALSAQTIANNCYDQPSLNNVFCGLFTRWRGPGNDPLGAQPGQIGSNSLISAGVNFAKRVRRGIDVNASYRKRITGNIGLDTNLIYVHGIKTSNYENPALPAFENRILGELGDPVDEFRWDADLKVGNVTFGYRLHYIGAMWVNAFEDFNALPTACTSAGCPPNNADYADVRKFPAVTYSDIRFQWDTGPAFGMAKNLQIYAGIDNIFDKHPPLGLSGTGTLGNDRGTGNAAIYDVRGRNYYAGIKARF